MESAVCETRLVFDRHAWKCPILIRSRLGAEYLDRQHLLECLDCIVEAVEA